MKEREPKNRSMRDLSIAEILYIGPFTKDYVDTKDTGILN